jgi:membrane associated rhomboid family serine protease
MVLRGWRKPRTRCAQNGLVARVDSRNRLAASVGVLSRLLPVVVMVALMWLVTGFNLLILGGAWLRDGVRAHDPSGFWPNLLFAPFLHVGMPHLLANSLPFLILGGLIALRSVWRFTLLTLAAALGAAMVAWVAGPSGSVHVGASGLVFAYFTWLIVRAIRERSLVAILFGLFALAIYGGILWGLSPFQTGISWQAHLGGAVAGVAAALMWPTPAPGPRQGALRLA